MSEELLIKFINNACTDDELATVKEWIDASDDNAKELFELERIAMDASSLRDDSGSKERVSKMIKQRIIAEQVRQQRGKRIKMRAWMSAAAAVALILVAAIYLFRAPDTRMLKVMALNESESVTLPDGSVVFLNVGSELTYPEAFADERKVSLTGEGFFKVAHDPEHPFVAEGHYINIKVLGTEFNFNSNESGENNVSLINGSVEVCANDNKKEGIVLVPGQKADYDQETGSLTVVSTNAQVDAAWHDRIIPFENATIADIADILTQLYGTKINIDGDIDLSKTFSGVTVYYSDIDSTLLQLCNTLPISYKTSGKTITLQKKTDEI